MSDSNGPLRERGRQFWKYIQQQVTILQQMEQPSGPQEADEFAQLSRDNHSGQREINKHVPWSLRVSAAWSWRLLVVIALVCVLLYGLSKILVVVIPVLVALLLAVLLEPLLRLLLKLKLPRTLAAALTLLCGIGLVCFLLWLATSQIATDMGDVVARAQQGIQQGIDWLSGDPLNLDTKQVLAFWNEIQSRVTEYLNNHATALATNAFTTVSSAATMLTGLLTALFCLFFFLKDGRKIWQWVLRLLPRQSRNPLNEAAIRGWITLGSYARTQTLVAAIDAVGIAGGAFILGVPFAVPLGVLVFLASFIPIVGAIVTGMIAVALALVNSGFNTALIMLLIILAVQQVESNLLQPALMSNAVNLHPMAVLLTVTAGGFIAGIPGAIFGVPIVAFVNTVVLYLKGYDNFLALNYRMDRPGGPPGSLDKEMALASRPTKANIEAAQKAKRKAQEQGFIKSAQQRASEADEIKEQVEQSLLEFKDDDPSAVSTESPAPSPQAILPGDYPGSNKEQPLEGEDR